MPTLVILIIAFLTGCVEPVTSDFQSARTLGKLNLELSGYGNTHISKPVLSQYNLGGQVGLGIHERIDLYVGYSLLYSPPVNKVSGELDWEDGKNEPSVFDNYKPYEIWHIASIGPKFSLIKDYLAVYSPIQVYIRDPKVATVTWAPTVLGSYQLIQERVEVTLGGKLITAIPFDTPVLALNLGLALGKLGKWAIWPEVGFMHYVGNSSVGWHAGLAYSYTFNLGNE